MNIKHAVIDGSNIATEGRDAPSLAQLDEAVSAFIDEYAPEIVTVVVDATFPNRIAAGERKAYEAAVAANELITPPAGAIGRGDGFVLQIARRVQATILSNDSFQEFHGQYPWLFEKGRLIGGKPVPHVGWVFMERAPVRGPTSRRAMSEARKEAKAEKAPASSASSVDAGAAAGVADGGGADAAPAPAPARRSRRKASPKVVADATPAVDAAVSGNGASARSGGSASSGSAGSAGSAGDAGAGGDGPDGPSGGRRRRAASVDKAALSESHNDLLPFLDFVQAHPVGTQVDATIEKFSSHGAYALVGEVRAYVPLRYLADPAPRSAKEVVALGETRSLLVVSIDPPRRGVDLGIPGVADVDAIPVEAATLVEEAKAAAGIESSTEVEAPAPAADEPARRSRKKAASEGEAPDAAVAGTTDATDEPAPARKASRRTRKAAAEAEVGAATGEAAPAKRTRKRASTAAPDATSDVSAPSAPDPAPAPAPAKRTRKRTPVTAAEPLAEAPPAPSSAPDAPAATPEPAPAPAPAKRTRKRASAPAAAEPLPAATTPSEPSAGAGDAPPAPAKRSRKRSTAQAAPQAEAGPEPAADATPTDAPAPAPAKRTRKRTPAPAPDGPGGADAPAAGPAPAPAKRTRKRVTTATTAATGDA